MAFDKSKPYKEIFGSTHDGARFVQAGVRYTTHGEKVGVNPNWVEPVAPAVPPKPKKSVLTMGRARPATMSHDKENRDALKAEDLSE